MIAVPSDYYYNLAIITLSCLAPAYGFRRDLALALEEYVGDGEL